ncbi:MAG: OsmC family protein [Bacteroidia bacterium]|nr:OsmC family protein [Bacteroidia bacterium]
MSITSRVEYIGNLRTKCIHIQSNSEVVTDAPKDNNGKGERFSPTDLVATSLASCMITVMGIKANNASISFKLVSAEVTKVMASNPRRICKIMVSFSIGDNWNKKERMIMEKTARTCPVAKSLSSEVLQKIDFSYTLDNKD